MSGAVTVQNQAALKNTVNVFKLELNVHHYANVKIAKIKKIL